MKWSSILALAVLAGSSSFAAAQVLVPQADAEKPRVQFADSLVSVNDLCAVAKRKLSTSISPVYVNGKPVAFCCTACPATFSKNPETYVKDFAPKLECPVNRGRDAVLEAATKTYVNQDVFFFSDAKAMKKFVANPLRYATTLTDPVSRHRFTPSPKSPHTKLDGRPFYFENAETFKAFQADPGSYAIRKGA